MPDSPQNLSIAMFLNVYHRSRKDLMSGAVQSTIDFMGAMREKGHSVYVFTTGKGVYKDAGLDAEYVFRCPSIPVKQGFGPALPELLGITLFGKKGKQVLEKCDVIHCHQPYPISDYAMKIAKKRGIPFIFTNHTQYGEYAKSHFPLSKILGQRYQNWVAKLNLEYVRNFANKCDLVIVPGKEMAEIVVNEYKYSTRVEICPNGIDYKLFSKGNAENIFKKYEYYDLKNKDVLIYTGRLEKEKNIADLLRAMAQVSVANPNAVLMLVGGGTEQQNLEALAEKLGLNSKVIFAGRVSHSEVPDYCAAAKIFVTASKTEVHPLTEMEAMAAGVEKRKKGCVVVAYDAPGSKDIVKNGKNGLLTKCEPKELADAIVYLLKDKEKLDELSKNAAHSAKEFSKQGAAERLLELYTDTIQAKSHHHYPQENPAGH